MSNHSPEEFLEKKLENVDIVAGELYYHYRTPNAYYKIIAIGLDEATEDPVVVYQAQYGKNLIWTRNVNNWCQSIEHNHTIVPRFIKIKNL
jgi:hypothetical protein